MLYAKSIQIIVLLTILPAVTVQANDQSSAHRVWDKQPIVVSLSVAHERRVQFRAPVSVGVPASLESALRVQSVNGTVYLQSYRPFPSTRLLVRELDGGQTYLLDVHATDSGALQPPMLVHLPLDDTPVQPGIKTAGPPGYVRLTRFIAQQLYAPERLIEAVPGAQRVPLQTEPVALLPGSAVQATPLLAWRAGDLHVTAVKLRNLSHRPLILDPRRLYGRWLSATFQHARLLPSGSDADTTAVYLVSAQAFAASL